MGLRRGGGAQEWQAPEFEAGNVDTLGGGGGTEPGLLPYWLLQEGGMSGRGTPGSLWKKDMGPQSADACAPAAPPHSGSSAAVVRPVDPSGITVRYLETGSFSLKLALKA